MLSNSWLLSSCSKIQWVLMEDMPCAWICARCLTHMILDIPQNSKSEYLSMNSLTLYPVGALIIVFLAWCPGSLPCMPLPLSPPAWGSNLLASLLPTKLFQVCWVSFIPSGDGKVGISIPCLFLLFSSLLLISPEINPKALSLWAFS